MSVTSVSPATLPADVAALRRLDPGLMERVRHEALTMPQDWVVEYGDYQNGGWHTLSLLNDSGNPHDVTIRDCPQPQPTILLERMHAVQDLIAKLGVQVMWARLARLDAGAFLWEHRDYGELSTIERHRLHVPLVTNSSAYLVLSGTKVHMSPGRVWRLTPTSPHGVYSLACYAAAAVATGDIRNAGPIALFNEVMSSPRRASFSAWYTSSNLTIWSSESSRGRAGHSRRTVFRDVEVVGRRRSGRSNALRRFTPRG